MINAITKIMNHKVTPTSGKTLTLGGLINASELELSAQLYNDQAANIKKISVLADGTFNTLTEVIQVAKQVADVNAAKKDYDTFVKLGVEFKDELDHLLATTIDGKKILTETTEVDLGLGSGTLELGLNLAEDAHYKVVEAATNSMALEGHAYGDQEKLDYAVGGLYHTAALASAKASFLNNRFHTLNDLAFKTRISTENQVVNQGGSPTSLLNTLF